MRLGTDPEVFLQDKSGKHISVTGFIKAGKLEPLQIPDMPEGFTLQEDNVALEYGIPPASSAKEFYDHIQAVMQRSRAWIPNLDFSKVSCTIFEDDQLQHPLTRVFGCEPDYNAWTGEENPKPNPPHPGMRSAGGHIHVETDLDPIKVVRAMDHFLGVPSVLMDTGKDRKQLYGKAGAFRKKSYGVEYRTLSNFWIFDRRLTEWVWEQTARALVYVKAGMEPSPLAQKIINTDNAELARKYALKHSLEVI